VNYLLVSTTQAPFQANHIGLLPYNPTEKMKENTMKNKGFTLIDFLILLAVVGIPLVLGYSQYMKMKNLKMGESIHQSQTIQEEGGNMK